VFLELAKDSLEMKRVWLQENIIEKNAIPAFMEYVGTLNNHFSTIGVVGMNEMCENFFGKGNGIITDEGKQLSIEITDLIRAKLSDFQEETGNLYNLEATPAESTAYRLAKNDTETFDDIITQGSGKDVYYTNSCHIPVKDVKSINETFKHQEDLQTQFTGGTVIHCYMEGAISGDQAKALVRALNETYKVPYMSLSPISRYCPEHGYVTEITDECPICGDTLEKYQRITGYLRNINNFNPGKAAEFNDRHQLDASE
jgi:ribonucleoside-triphosphate reductase